MKRDCPELDRLERVHKLQEKAERPQFNLRDTSLVSKRPKMVHKRDSSLVKRMAARLKRFALKQIDRAEVALELCELGEDPHLSSKAQKKVKWKLARKIADAGLPPQVYSFGP